MRPSLRVLACLTALGCGWAHAQPLLRVIVEPAMPNVRVDRIAEIRVYLQSGEAHPLPIDAGYLAIQWDQPHLWNETPALRSEPFPMDSSYWAPGVGLNTSVLDGDAYREVLAALPASFGDPFPAQAPVAPDRLLMTTFQHRVQWSETPVLWRLRAAMPDGTTTRFTVVFRGGVVGTYRLEFDSAFGSDLWITPWTRRADLDKDGYVDIDDYLIMAPAYETMPGDPTWDPRADIDRNGLVDIDDYLILAEEYET